MEEYTGRNTLSLIPSRQMNLLSLLNALSSDDISDDRLNTRLNDVLTKLVPLQNLSPEGRQLVSMLEKLFAYYYQRDDLSSFVDTLLNSGFCGLYKRLLDKHLISALENEDSETIKCLKILMNIIFNCSNSSKYLCEQLEKNSIINTYVGFLKNLILKEGEQDIAYILLGTLWNSVHVNKVEECRSLLRKLDVINILKIYRLSSDEKISFIALVIQAYLVSEKENDSLNSDIKTFTFMLQILDRALNGRTMNGSSFSPEEVLDAANILAVCDANKLKLVQAGVLTYYFAILKEKYDVSNRAVAMVAEGLWLLSFKCKNEIKQFKGYQKVLVKAQDHQCKNVKENVEGINWELKNEEHHTGKKQENNQNEQHVFISYQRSYMETILKVKDHLQKKGYNTWVDEDDMSGSVLKSMATAVQNASVVLVCISDKYKESVNCRAEGEYAFHLNRKVIPLKLQENYVADGWLGMLIGSQLVHDLSKPEKFDKSMISLIKTLKALKIKRSMKPCCYF